MSDQVRQRAYNTTYSYNPNMQGDRGFTHKQQAGEIIPTWVLVCSIGTSLTLVVLLSIAAIYHEELGNYILNQPSPNEPIDWATCGNEHELCNTDFECCSRVCYGGACSCKQAGEKCTRNENCCAADCVNGECTHFECKEGGEACSSNAECCTEECVDGLCADFENRDNCLEPGNQCDNDFSCCSFICQKGLCVECMEKNEGCERDEECCNEHCDLSVHRCNNCNAEGEECASDSDCCTNKCFDGYCMFEEYEEDPFGEQGADDTFEEFPQELDEGGEHEYDHHDQQEDPADWGEAPVDEIVEEFIPANTYEGPMHNYKWKKHGPQGPGYYFEPVEG